MVKMSREIDDAELEAAMAETYHLHSLGGKSTGAGTQAPAPPIVTPGNPWSQVVPTRNWGVNENATTSVVEQRPALYLDGAKQAFLGGRTFELTDAEMSKVMGAIEKAYARAMKGELAKVKETILGAKKLRKMQEESSTPDAQDLRRVPVSRAMEITYPDAPPERSMPVVWTDFARSEKVPTVSGSGEGSDPTVANPFDAVPRGAATPSIPARESMHAHRTLASSIKKGGGDVAGGSG